MSQGNYDEVKVILTKVTLHGITIIIVRMFEPLLLLNTLQISTDVMYVSEYVHVSVYACVCNFLCCSHHTLPYY